MLADTYKDLLNLSGNMAVYGQYFPAMVNAQSDFIFRLIELFSN